MHRKDMSGIAARAGRWSASHRKTAIVGWLAFILVAFAIGSGLGPEKPTTAQRADGESRRAEQVLDRAGFPAARGGEMVLVQTSRGTVEDPEARRAITDVVDAVSSHAVVADVVSPLAGGSVSADKRSALVEFQVEGDPATAGKRLAPVSAELDRVAERHPGVTIGQFGSNLEDEVKEHLAAEQAREMSLSMSAMLVILVLTFGALVAAAVPVLLAMTAVAGTIGLTAIASQFLPQDPSSLQAIVLIGLAVGVDYSLFYVRREREERAAGRSRGEALDIAAATSGRAVLVSGLTVMIAMAGMFVTGNATLMSMGLAAILVVAVAVLGSLTVLPAVLSVLGDRVEKGRIPFLGRRRSEARDSRAWGWVVDRVLRRPVVALVLAGGALLALSIPGLGLETKLSGIEEMPQELSSVQTYKKVQQAFPAEAGPATVVVEARDVEAPAVRSAIADLQERAERDPQVTGPIGVEVNPDRTVARLSVGLPGNGSDEASLDGLAHLREELLPATLDRVQGVSADVTGSAAYTADFNTLMRSRTPLVFAFVLGLAFVLMLVSFRSIVVPIKAIVLNLLSVGASYGMLKLVFQDGHGEKVLGFESNGGVTTYLPLFLFVILFGLSMDYHVFILSRVREAWSRGMSSDQAVAHGIKSTAGTVTSAAVIMVAVFAAMATGSTLDAKEMGVGLAFAVLIDATVIRGVLLPASMKLLGDRNWYLPRWLEWLPRLDLEGEGGRPGGERAHGRDLGPLPDPAAA
jgi:RND superfamily putative drug exporter